MIVTYELLILIIIITINNTSYLEKSMNCWESRGKAVALHVYWREF